MEKESKLSVEKETYIAPDIEVVDIETEQNILYSGSGGGEAPDMPAIPW